MFSMSMPVFAGCVAVIVFVPLAHGQSAETTPDMPAPATIEAREPSPSDLLALSTPLALHLDPALLQDQSTADVPDKRLRSWELPPVKVVGESTSSLEEEQRVGSYGQPRWTAERRFSTTRVYVIPEGKVEVEAWARGTFDHGESEWRFLQEIEIGLPGRFQLDLYARQDYSTEDNETLWGGQFEVRWALADWGKIWGNPTLYFEYLSLESRPDKIEPKLLLGDEITERWHWALNFVAELELSGEREYEYELTAAISYTVVDSKFSVGLETTMSWVDTEEDRGNYENIIFVGPDFQWKPVPAFTVNVAVLAGVTNESPDAQIWLNLGWEF